MISNARNHRQNPLVPLIVPTANPEHLRLIAHQRHEWGLTRGFLVTISNCSTAGVAVAVKALQEKFGRVEKIMVTTLQAVSGAGYPGVASLDILGNVFPNISGEEAKMESEPKKILGSRSTDTTDIVPVRDMSISATCTRVPVIDGHTECLAFQFARNSVPMLPTRDAIIKCFRDYAPSISPGAPSSFPQHAIAYLDQIDRPQPVLDRNTGNGNTVSIGQLRKCPVLDYKLVLLVHNTILGAAGAGILIAELAASMNFL